MTISTILSTTRKDFIKAARLACIVMLILLAAGKQSSASSLYTLEEEHGNSVQAVQSDSSDAVPPATTAPSATADLGSAKPDATAVTKTGDGETSSIAAAGVESAPDWDGIFRDTGIILGAQVGAAAVTYLMPQSFSGWSAEQKRNSFKKYSRNFTHPVMDKDKAYINYGLHPYWGATYYTRARERNLDKATSFAYSAFMSAMYEFGAECLAERPSIQDLIVTPVGGSLLGAFVFEPIRNSIKSKSELRWYDHTLLVVTDPLGVLSLGVEKLFGIKSTITVDYAPSIKNNSAGSNVASSGSRIGVVMQFPLN